MVRFGVVWFGVVRFGVVWFGVVRCGVVGAVPLHLEEAVDCVRFPVFVLSCLADVLDVPLDVTAV